MADVYVNPIRLNELSVTQYNISKEIDSLSRQILTISDNISFEGYAGVSVRNTLRNLSSITNDYSLRLSSASSALSKIATQYTKTESEISGQQSTVTVTAASGVKKNYSGSQVTSPWKWAWKDTAKIAASAGPFGGIAALGMNVANGEKVTTSGKTLASLIGSSAGTVVEYQKGNPVWWKNLYGGNTVSLNGNNTFRNAFTKEIDKLNFGNATTVAQKTKVAAKWAGNALTLANNGMENYYEFQGQDGMMYRAIGETVLETGTDIGVGMAASAAATAAAAYVGAPVILAGAGAVVIVWGANSACKWVTSELTGEAKDLGEVVADGAMDTIEFAGNTVKTGAKAIFNGAKNAVSTVNKAGQKVGNTITNWVRSVNLSGAAAY